MMTNKKDNLHPLSLVNIDGLDPQFLAAIQEIIATRPVRDDVIEPAIQESILADADRLNPGNSDHIAYYFYIESIKAKIAEFKIKEQWKVIKDIISNKLAIANYNDATAGDIIKAVVDISEDNASTPVESHILLLELTIQEFLDGQITAERLKEFTEAYCEQFRIDVKLLFISLSETQPTYDIGLSQLFSHIRWYCELRHALLILTPQTDGNSLEDENNEGKTNRATLLLTLDETFYNVVSIVCSIANGAYIDANGTRAEENEDNLESNVLEAYTIAEIISQSTENIVPVLTNLFTEYAKSSLPDPQRTVEGFMNLLMIYSRSTVELQKDNRISETELIAITNRILHFSWEYLTFNSAAKDTKPWQKNDRLNSIVHYSGRAIAILGNASANSDITDFYSELIKATSFYSELHSVQTMLSFICKSGSLGDSEEIFKAITEAGKVHFQYLLKKP